MSLAPAHCLILYNMSISPHLAGQFVCSVCSRSYASKKNLKRHHNSHTGQNSKFCHLCGKRFYRQDMLNGHLQTCLSRRTEFGPEVDKTKTWTFNFAELKTVLSWVFFGFLCILTWFFGLKLHLKWAAKARNWFNLKHSIIAMNFLNYRVCDWAMFMFLWCIVECCKILQIFSFSRKPFTKPVL